MVSSIVCLSLSFFLHDSDHCFLVTILRLTPKQHFRKYKMDQQLAFCIINFPFIHSFFFFFFFFFFFSCVYSYSYMCNAIMLSVKFTLIAIYTCTSLHSHHIHRARVHHSVFTSLFLFGNQCYISVL